MPSSQQRTRRSAPRALAVATAAWFGLGVMEIAVGGSGFLAKAPDDGADQLSETYGPGYLTASGHQIGLDLAITAAGVLTVALLPRLLAGRKGAAYTLPPLSALIVVVLAFGGHTIGTVTGLLLLAIGTVPFMTARTHRYLHGLRERPSPKPRPSPRPRSGEATLS